MENFEKQPNKQEMEMEDQYNFEEIAEAEPAMIELVSQMKERIDNGEYDTLISDEVGGRIPTLVIRKIIRARNPGEKLYTYFVSGGNYLSSKDGSRVDELGKYLEKRRSDGRALIVTQYAHSGRSLELLTDAARKGGLTNFDVATLNYNGSGFNEDRVASNLDSDGRVFKGRTVAHHLREDHEKLAGVRKPKKKFSPHPLSEIDVTKDEGRILSDEEWREIYKWVPYDDRSVASAKLRDPEYIAEQVRREAIPLSDEEKKAIKENVRLARKDVAKMAGRVIKSVWGEQENSD